MADLAELRIRFADDASRGAEAAAAAIRKVGVAAEESDQKVTRAGQSAEALARKYIEAERAAAAKEQAERRHARAIEEVARQEAAGAINAERAATLRQSIARQAEVDAARIVAAAERRAQAVALLLGGGAAAGGGVVGGTAALNAYAAANDNASRSGSRFGQVMGQAGFQVQDFATQVSMGQNALVAFGVQFAQFAGIFGTAGALAGAAVTVGVIAAQLLRGQDAAQQFNEVLQSQDSLYRATADAGERYRRGLSDEAEQVLRLRTAYANYSTERLRAEELRLGDRQAQIEREQAGLTGRAAGLSGLASLPSALANVAQLSGARAARGQGGAEISQQLREAAAAVMELRAQGTASAEVLSRYSNQLQDAAAIAGDALAPGLLAAARQVRELIPEADRLSRAADQNAQLMQALREQTGGAGATMGSAASEAQRFAAALLGIARINIADPLAAIERQIGQTEAQMRALRSGGLAGLQGERDAQERARAGEEAYTRVLREQMDALERLGISEQDRETRASEAARAARGRAEEGARLQQQLRDDERAAQERQREIERAARAAQRNQRPATQYEFGAPGQTVFPVEVDQYLLRMRERADREAERLAEGNARRLDRTVERWGDSLADATFQALEAGAMRGEDIFASLASSFSSILRRAVANAMSETVFQPLVRSGLNAAGVTGADSGPGSILGQLGSLPGVSSLREMLPEGVSFGGLFAAGGLGAFGGGMLARAMGGNATYGSGGGGIGAAAGLLLSGGNPIFAALGGVAGGALGGMLGPGAGFSGGDALVGANDNGLLSVARYAGKNFQGAGQLMAQTQQEVAAFNASLVAAGLRLKDWTRNLDYLGAVGGGESGNPRTLMEALDAAGGASLLTSDDPAALAALSNGGGLSAAIQAAATARSNAEARRTQIPAIERTIRASMLRATGRGDEAAWMELNAQREAEWQGTRDGLRNIGTDEATIDRIIGSLWDAYAAQDAAARAQKEAASAQERSANMQRAAASASGAIGGVSDFLRGLRGSDLNPAGPVQRLSEAERTFWDDIQGAWSGDASAIGRSTRSAEALLRAQREVNGSGSAFAEAFERVTRMLGDLGNMGEERLTANFFALETQNQTESLVAAIGRLQSEVAALRRDASQRAASPLAA